MSAPAGLVRASAAGAAGGASVLERVFLLVVVLLVQLAARELTLSLRRRWLIGPCILVKMLSLGSKTLYRVHARLECRAAGV